MTGPAEATAVVLAGGRSTRFGRDKLLEPYRGVPMLHRVVDRVATVCDDVVIVLAPAAAEPPVPEGIPVRFARDPTEGEGPLAGLSAGLGVVRTALALVAAGDMPELQPAVLVALLRIAATSSAAAVALEDGGRPRPLPCVVRTEPAAEAAARLLGAGRRRLRDLLEDLRAEVVAEPVWRTLDPQGRTLFDVDLPADLEA